jgi:hypothetical protein
MNPVCEKKLARRRDRLRYERDAGREKLRTNTDERLPRGRNRQDHQIDGQNRQNDREDDRRQ